MSDTRFWRDRSVLVTGGTGLLGSWLVKSLADAEALVVCLIRDWVPQSELIRSGILSRIQIVRGDVRDQALLERVLGEYEVNSVFHAAAQTIVGIANQNPISTFQTNIAGTWALLEACRRSPAVQQIVVASSDKAYGEQAKLPYVESLPLMGSHPYEVSKSCADLISASYAKTWGVPVVVTRCGNLFGGGDLNWNRLVPGTIRSVLHGERPVIRSDGRYVRDYFYVDDAVQAYLLLAERLAADRSLIGEAFNFSNELHLPVLEIVKSLLRTMASNLEPDIRNDARHEIREQYLSARKAREMLGWKSVYSLEEAMRRTIGWYTEFFSTGPTGPKTDLDTILQLRLLARDDD